MANDCTIQLTINAEEAIKNLTTVENQLSKLVATAERAQEALSGIELPHTSTADLSQLQSALGDLTQQMSSGFETMSERLGMVVNNTAGGAEGTITYLTAINEQLSRLPVGQVERASQATTQLAKSSKSAAGSTGSLLKFFKGITRTIASFTMLYRVARRFIRLVSQGFEHMTEYSENYRNATNQLKNSFETFKLQLAGAFEPIMSTVLPYLARLIDALTVATDKVAQFLAVISGRSTYNKAVKQMRDFAKEAQAASNSLAGFDELNVLSDGGGGGDTGPWWEEADVTLNLNKMLGLVGKLESKFKELSDIFVEGFLSTFDWKGGTIADNFRGMWDAYLELITNPNILGGANSLFEKLTFNTGAINGSFANVGQNIALNITSAINDWLDNGGKDSIEEHMLNLFSLVGQSSDLLTGAVAAVSTISDALSSEAGVSFTENILGTVSDVLIPFTDWAAQFSIDITKALTDPFTNNAGGFEKALEGFLGNASTIIGGLKDAFSEFGEKWESTYSEKIQPVIQNIGDGLSELVGDFLDFWNNDVQPVLDDIAEELKGLMDGELGDFFNNVCEGLGEIGEFLGHVFSLIKTVLAWIVKNVLPLLMPIIKAILQNVVNTTKAIITGLNGVVTFIKGVFQIINGIITGDGAKIKQGVSSLGEGIWKIIAGAVNGILAAVQTVAKTIIETINAIINGINAAGGNVPTISTSFIDLWQMPTTAPWLANGGVTTGSTLAHIGEAGREAVLPLERDTGWADIVADKLAERMNGGGTYTFVAEIDGKTLFNETVKQNRMYQKSTGRSAFGY